MTSIDTTFDGSFKYQSSPDTSWDAVSDSKKSFQCENTDVTDRTRSAEKYQLMNDPVQPISPQPIYINDYQK